jgi:hypothetical protein
LNLRPDLLPSPATGSSEPEFRFDAIADALAAIRNGEVIVVVDDENRENEGDLICAAQLHGYRGPRPDLPGHGGRAP